jgi:predicted NACHT family NTPase
MSSRKSKNLFLKTLLIYLGILLISIGVGFWINNIIIPLLSQQWKNTIWLGFGIAFAIVPILGAIAETLGYSIKNLIDPDKAIEISEQNNREHFLRIRRLLLDTVQRIWIEGALNKSLHGLILLEVSKHDQEDRVNHPWRTVLKTFDASPNSIISDTNIINAFKATNNALLIIGGPGSGKTTTLLELAQSKLKEAQVDTLAPIPIILQLSTWGQIRKSISEWILEELRRQYGVNQVLGRNLLQNENLLLFLDGLDEVKEEYRTHCVKELNKFRNDYGATQVAVTCRTADYDALSLKLNLNGAIILQELSDEQIEQYLRGTGFDLLAVQRTLELDSELKALARSPLFLNVMVLAYRGMTVEELRNLDKNETRRNHIWRHYVQRMYDRRLCEYDYSLNQTKRWLGWLAHRMTLLPYTYFFAKTMKAEWLESPSEITLSNMLSGICSFSFSGILLA